MRRSPGVVGTSYRLSVSEDRVLADATVASQRLRPLGLSIMELDLGWEEGNLPSTFSENERFLPMGLRGCRSAWASWASTWASGRPRTRSASSTHWRRSTRSGCSRARTMRPSRCGRGSGSPTAISTLSISPTQAHRRGYGTACAAWPNAGCATSRRTSSANPVCSLRVDGTTAPSPRALRRGRMGAEIIAEQMAEGLVLNCGGPEMPGRGQWPLLYTCQDYGQHGHPVVAVPSAITSVAPPATCGRTAVGASCSRPAFASACRARWRKPGSGRPWPSWPEGRWTSPTR